MLKKPIAFFIAASAIALAQSPVQTTLDGRLLTFDQPAMMQGGRVMVPLRGIFESLGADVLFNPATRTIKATKEDRVVELTLGSRQALINGQVSYLDVPAGTIGGRTLVPLRFVSEALGADVKWNPATRTVALTSTTPPSDLSDLPTTPTQARPSLSNLVHNARRTLDEGDRLVVTFNGDPGGQATFDLLGVTNGVPMREVASGRYEGELTITSGMQASSATIVARLRRGNQEAVLESPRAVSINADNNNSNNLVSVSPAQGSVVNTYRPTIHANLDRQLSSARIFLDGTEVTGQAQIMNSAIHYVPTSDLSPGYHRVSVQAVDRRGRLITRDWDFSVYGSGYSSTMPGVPVVSLTNLANGANVPGVFNVQGQTKPYSQVHITAQAQRSLIPGVIGFQDRVASVTRQADAFGRFDIPMDVSQVPINTPLNLEIRASDTEGRTSYPTRLDVTRR